MAGLFDLRVYTMAMGLAEEVWSIVEKWDSFARKTIGAQVIRSVDSVAANISEGYGRYHYKESKHFLYYARGSLYETETWLIKAKNRKLIEEKMHVKLSTEIETLKIKLNAYIKSIGKTNNH